MSNEAPEIWTRSQSVSYKSERDFFFFPKVPTHLHGHRGLGHQGLASWSQKWEYCQTRKLLPWSQGKSGKEAYVSFHKSSYSLLSKSILLFSLFISKHPPTPLFFMVYPKDLWIILIVTQPTILTVFIWHEARIFQGTLIRKKHKKKRETWRVSGLLWHLLPAWVLEAAEQRDGELGNPVTIILRLLPKRKRASILPLPTFYLRSYVDTLMWRSPIQGNSCHVNHFSEMFRIILSLQMKSDITPIL